MFRCKYLSEFQLDEAITNKLTEETLDPQCIKNVVLHVAACRTYNPMIFTFDTQFLLSARWFYLIKSPLKTVKWKSIRIYECFGTVI